MNSLLAMLLVPALTTPIEAPSGHGPVFGLATPTNPAKGWTLDLGLMGRAGGGERGSMFRAMVSYGITEDFQISASGPAILASGALPPTRGTAMMPATGDIEGIAAWRFHRRGTAVGTRVESTAYGGIIAPGPQRPRGMAGDLARAPGFYAALATGVASRSHYAWGGFGYMRFLERNRDRRSDVLLYTAVWGYRPVGLRKDYPHWDWRGFVELTGERFGGMIHAGVHVPATRGHQVFLGPAVLGIYRNYAIQGGVQFPVYRRIGSAVAAERLRVAMNFSYFF